MAVSFLAVEQSHCISASIVPTEFRYEAKISEENTGI